MTRRTPLVVLIFLILFSGCSNDQSGGSEPIVNGLNNSMAVLTDSNSVIEGYLGVDRSKEELDTFFRSKMDEMSIPGLSFAMINDGRVVHHTTMGYANLEEGLPVTAETIFEGASISKSVFAFFVMTYVDEGLLDLDRPLYEYLPEPDLEYDNRYRSITARMILSHRSGLPNWRSSDPDGRLRIYFDPGTDYRYSGEGYQYLARVLMQIEGIDDRGLEAAFQRKVAEPMGLQHTVFLQSPYTREHKAEAYNQNNERLDLTETGEFGSAYSIHTEAMDFSRWMIAVMNQELLPEVGYDELFTPYSSVPSSTDFELFYTLGFMTPDLPDSDIYMHSGNNEGFTCMFLLDPERDWGFALFTNSEFGEDLGNELAGYLAAEPD